MITSLLIVVVMLVRTVVVKNALFVRVATSVSTVRTVTGTVVASTSTTVVETVFTIVVFGDTKAVDVLKSVDAW
jgi:hypothetical protein